MSFLSLKTLIKADDEKWIAAGTLPFFKLLTIATSGVLVLLSGEYAPMITLALTAVVGAIIWFPQQRWNLMLIGTILFWFIGPAIPWFFLAKRASYLGIFDSRTLFFTELGATLALAMLILVLLGIARRLPKIQAYAVPAVLIIYLVIRISSGSLPPLYAAAIALLLSRFTWFLMVNLRDQSKTRKNLLQQLTMILPFWSRWSVPIPFGIHSLEELEPRDELAASRSRLHGIRLLVWVVLLHAFRLLILSIAFNRGGFAWLPHLSLPDTEIYGYGILTAYQGPEWCRLLALFTRFFTKLLSLTVTFGMNVALLRLSGFYALRHIYKPLYANSIGEYFRRLIYYYSEVIVHLFYEPIYKSLAWMRRRRLRRLFSVFAAIVIAGICYHFTSDAGLAAFLSFREASLRFSHRIPYFFALAFIVSTSVVFRHRKRNRTRPFIYQYIFRPFWNLSLIGLVMTLQKFFFFSRNATWAQYGEFLSSLLRIFK